MPGGLGTPGLESRVISGSCTLSRLSTSHSMSRTPPIFTPLKLDFNFGAAPHNAPPSVVLIVLKNSGLVPLDWYGYAAARGGESYMGLGTEP